MKNLTRLLVIAILLILSAQIYSQQIHDLSTNKKVCCVKSLLQGLESDNAGLQAGCAYMLGEVCCSKSVVPLMNVLHNNPSEEMRILAALALYKIGDSRGLFAIKQEIKFDESERVRQMCEKFYKAHLQEENSPEVNLSLK